MATQDDVETLRSKIEELQGDLRFTADTVRHLEQSSRQMEQSLRQEIRELYGHLHETLRALRVDLSDPSSPHPRSAAKVGGVVSVLLGALSLLVVAVAKAIPVLVTYLSEGGP
jgi:chromosome segregation ATPase